MTDSDFIRDLGRPFVAHRLKRLSERIVAASGDYLGTQGITAPPKSASTLLLLREESPLTITTIAARLRLSHSMVIKLTSALADQDLVKIEVDASDQRRRLVSLTQGGAEQAQRFSTFAQLLDRTLEELVGEIGVDLIEVVERFELALDEQSLAQRLDRAAATAAKLAGP